MARPNLAFADTDGVPVKSQGDAAFASAIAQLRSGTSSWRPNLFSSNTSPGEIANEKGLTGLVSIPSSATGATAMTYYQAAVALSAQSGDAPGLLAAINASQAGRSPETGLCPEALEHPPMKKIFSKFCSFGLGISSVATAWARAQNIGVPHQIGGVGAGMKNLTTAFPDHFYEPSVPSVDCPYGNSRSR